MAFGMCEPLFRRKTKNIKTQKQNTHKNTIMKTKQILIALSLFAFTLLISAFNTSAQSTGSKTPLSLQLSAGNPSCYASNDGSIVVDILGGFPPYYVNGIEVAGSQVIFDNLSAGPYSIYVSDTLLSSAEVQVILISPLQLEMSAVVSNVSIFGGNDGAIDLTVNNQSVSYSWMTPDGSGLVENLEDQSGLSAGTYAVTVTEANGCETSKRFTVEQAPQGFGTGTPSPNVNPNTNGSSSSNGSAIF